MKKDYFLLIFLGLIAFLSRVFLLEHFQSHWDGPQYSIAILRYSLVQETPAPPGYPIYIALGKLFYFFTHDPHKAILAVSVLGSVLGVMVFYFVGRKMVNPLVGIVAALIFLTGSTFYYFGITAYAYGFLPALTTLLGFVVYEIFVKRKNWGIFLGLVSGFYFGFRPQEMLQVGPLVLLGFIFLSNKEKLKMLIAFFAFTIVWSVPFFYLVGFKEYFEQSRVFAAGAFPDKPFLQNAELVAKGFLLSFGVSVFFLFYYLWKIIKEKHVKNWKLIVFFSVWILPGLCFNLFVRTEHAGYQMSYLSGFLLLIAYAVWRMTNKNKILFFSVVSIIGLFNLFCFFYDRDPTYVKPYRPTSFHYSDIRKNDLKVGSKVLFVQNKFDSSMTLIVSTDTLWRPYMYYLKEYRYIALVGLSTKDLKFVHNRFDAIHWEMKQSKDWDMSIKIPKGVSTVVFMDDGSSDWIKKYPFQIFKLPGNSNITVIKVKTGDTVIYGYHFLKIVR